MLAFLTFVVAYSLALPSLSAPSLFVRQSGSGNSTSAGNGTSGGNRNGTTTGLLSPQNVPQPCFSTCTALEFEINGCQDDECVCTNANIIILAVCLDCVTFYHNDLESEAQSILDNLTQECNSEGLLIISQTLTPVSTISFPSLALLNSITSRAVSSTVSALGATIPVTMTAANSSPSPSTTSAGYSLKTPKLSIVSGSVVGAAALAMALV